MIDSDIAVVMGTRPEMIKLAHIIRQLGERARVIHTGQHFDDELSEKVRLGLRLPEADVVLTGVGGETRATQVASCLSALTQEFTRSRPKAVIVQGDTNTVAAGAMAANFAGIPLLHVEAGLRSYDRGMPEEINRLLTGVLADVHCAATDQNRRNLILEGIDNSRIVVTGNPIVEATLDSLSLLAAAPPLSIPEEPFVLATIHRPENTDSKAALERVLSALATLPLPVLFVAHPRTKNAMRRYGLEHYAKSLWMIDSIQHHEFLGYAQASALLISDSGGLQEECTVLKVPLLVVRRSTERPESSEVGFSVLVGPGEDITATARGLLATPNTLQNVSSPYGDGTASTRIAALAKLIADGYSPAAAIAQMTSTFPLFGASQQATEPDTWEWA
ncbi:UDP-N-acetylglucosamine 2-epimerase (non-hydrolyzing) [Psychromicrobium silvestre]|uniref:UDP-N-acetylglucosamine 2-epimerase (Non-hydrolyzing) n=1 Tax=Psychromicrobium silvestre TaxID=1645614 RepID=A0A7Y9LVT0_9MICC|nr:UDP-N-acetylglucosamine 2-epimerase (non-hydrolyzing) [Psychromicrobium silvestre]NYE96512.1 UDP-N-acetylglucosamine 2-epimerase (non-hydrolyzing) [Psychromicrobium silvestre]